MFLGPVGDAETNTSQDRHRDKDTGQEQDQDQVSLRVQEHCRLVLATVAAGMN